jgi:phenylacetate-CoA ligase
MREALEAAFRCQVLDRYGAVEGCVFAGQCEHGRYHVSLDVGIVEILDSKGDPCEPGERAEIVCTGLMNTLQPLIRYQIGDVSSWALDQTCLCGRHTPILDRIEGRVEDVCLTRDGREITRFTHVFKGMVTIRQAQVVQQEPDLFVVYVVPGEGFGDLETAKITENMRQHVGDARIRVERVPEIPLSASGKFRPTLCKLTPEQRRQVLEGATISTTKRA